MSLHKLTAGDGYTYLTRQVAADDNTELGREKLEAYYSQKGESPGRWLGSGLTGLGTVSTGDQVTEEQMKALFGEGLHPDAEPLRQAARAAGKSAKQAAAATRLGHRFRHYSPDPEGFMAKLRERYEARNAEQGLPRDWPLPVEERSRIRTELGRETFAQVHGRGPMDDRELAGHIARSMRPQGQSVAGYDLTFSPVKSVSTLWAVAPRAVSEQIEEAHDAAVADVLGWLEREVAYTREGTDGVRQVDVTGLIAGAFTHRDSRAGDPDLHTHVAVSNKVQAAISGKWLALDGQVIYKATVAASERYNTRLEQELSTRLGVRFTERGIEPGKRPVRELVGVDAELMKSWSRRRAAIDTRRVELAEEFQATHGRTPTPAESLKLAQQATLETREAKHEPRSLAEQRTAWGAEAARVLGDVDGVEQMVEQALSQDRPGRVQVTDDLVEQMAEQVVSTVEGSRATWQKWHVTAESERVVRASGVLALEVDAVVSRVVDRALTRDESVRITRPDGVIEPEGLRRADGTSVYVKAGSDLYTSQRIQAAEELLVAAAKRLDGRQVPDAVVEVALLEQAANGPALNPAQTQMVRELATSGARVQLVLAPAGSGKTTGMRVLARAWTDHGGHVVGLAPSAVAAQGLGEEIEAPTDTLAKLVHALKTGTGMPEWAEAIDSSSLIIIDEAGMAGTADLAVAVDFAITRGASVRLVGDDQQLASVAAGGVLRDIAEEVGAVTLSQLMRFQDATEGAATLALRDGDTAAVGFYIDNERVHLAPEGGEADQVFAAWQADRAAGKSSLMLAPTRDLVTELNARARADRVGHGEVTTDAEAALGDETRASVGDRIVTRRNDRRLRISATDWVKNGDRWTVAAVHDDKSLTVVHADTERSIRLPADYVAEHVRLGYASTVHGAQGMTVDRSHVLVTGAESRQLLYVALSRGREANHIYVGAGGQGDPHATIRPDVFTPATAVEILDGIVRRDGAQRSVRTEIREQRDASRLLGQSAERYGDAVLAAVAEQTPPDVLEAIDTAAETLVPGVSEAATWDVLRSRLALLSLTGTDPQAALEHAVSQRELDTADDIAAVLDWRLAESRPGPLPWLPAIPTRLAEHDTWGPYLRARADLVTKYAAAVRETAHARAGASLPSWARGLVEHRDLLADLVTWRAAHHIEDTVHSPTGKRHPATAHRVVQEDLERRVVEVVTTGPKGPARWKQWLSEYEPRVLDDPYWPVLAERLTIATAAGMDTTELLTEATTRGPLPDEHPAAALWWRVAEQLPTAAAVDAAHGAGASRLRPPWTTRLEQLLGQDLARYVLTDAEWPVLVGAVHAATAEGHTAEDLLEHAVGMLDLGTVGTPEGIPRTAVATVLRWRLHDVVAPPAEVEQVAPDSEPVPDDVEEFLHQWAQEADGEHPGLVPNVPPLPTDEPEEVVRDEAPDPVTTEPEHPPVTKARVLDLNAEALRFWQEHYEGSGAAAYVASRLGTDLRGDDRFPVGYAPAGWDHLAQHLTAGGAAPHELVEAGLAKYSRRGTLIDVFRDRVVFGIHDRQQHLVGFTARANPNETDPRVPKYLNTPATPAFSKGAVLFGLHAIPEIDPDQLPPVPVITEGAFDVIATTLAGDDHHYGVAPLGTAFTDAQADSLRPYPIVVQAGDNDKAGRQAVDATFWKLAARGITAHHATLPEGQDPASVREDLPQLLAQAAPTVTSLLDAQVAQFNLQWVTERVAAARTAARYVAVLPPDQWQHHADHIATISDVSEDVVLDQVIYAAVDWDPTQEEPWTAPGAKPLSTINTATQASAAATAKLRARLAELAGEAGAAADTPATPAPRHDTPTTDGPRGPQIG